MGERQATPRHSEQLRTRPALDLDDLQALAVDAELRSMHRFTPGDHPSTLRNAHYANRRWQVGHALAGPYNSLEGDVRLRDGTAVMQHDSRGRYDLTFQQWAEVVGLAGKHLRIDLKEPAALDSVAASLRALDIPHGAVTINVHVRTPWNGGLDIARVNELADRFHDAWITINLPLPFHAGYRLASRFARDIDHDRLGVAVLAGFARRADIVRLRRSFAVVNAWNIPGVGEHGIDAESRLRDRGVNGMIDLRDRRDPLARP